MTHFWGKRITDYLKLTIICLLRKRFLTMVRNILLSPGGRFASSLLLRVRLSGFTNVLSLAVEDLVSLLGGVVFATLVGLGTSSFG